MHIAPQHLETDEEHGFSSEGVFSPLDLQDRVVIMALFYEIVRVEQVETLWKQWKRHGKHIPLWRMLVSDPDVNAEAVYDVAAQVYGFNEIDLSVTGACALLQKLTPVFSREHWELMVRQHLLPVEVGETPGSGEPRLIFATHDPTHPDVQRILQELKLDNYELRYAARSTLDELITAVFEDRYSTVPDVDWMDYKYEPEDEEPEADFVNNQETPESLVDWFEGVLVAAHRQGASEVHICLGPRNLLEIFFLVDEDFELWRRETSFHPEGVLAFVVESLMGKESLGRNEVLETTLQRWIDSELARFHISVQLVFTELQAPGSGRVVIRALGNRMFAQKSGSDARRPPGGVASQV